MFFFFSFFEVERDFEVNACEHNFRTIKKITQPTLKMSTPKRPRDHRATGQASRDPIPRETLKPGKVHIIKTTSNLFA